MPLRTRLILVTLSSIVLVAGLLTAAGWIAQQAAEDRLQHMATSKNAILWQQVISNQLDRMQAAMFGLTRNQVAIRALEQGDRNTLAASMRPTYNRLRTSRIITQLVVVDTNGAIVFSTPNSYSESTLSPLISEATGMSKIKRGLLKNRDNQLIAFFAFPLYVRHVRVGIGLFVHDLQNPLEAFNHYDSTEAFIVHADGTPAYATNPEMLSRLNLVLPQPGQSTLSNTKLGSRIYAITISPLTDITGAPQAHLVSIKDHTTAYARQQMITRLTYTLMTVVLVLSLIGLSWYVHHALSPLRVTIAPIHTLSVAAPPQDRATADSPAEAPPVPAPVPTPPDTAALDAHTIDALKTLCPDNSTAFLQELITPFLQEASDQLTALNLAVDAADTCALDNTAHALKGSCTYMGALNMAILCQHIQALSQQPITPMADIITAIEELTAEFDRVRQALESETRQMMNPSEPCVLQRST